MAGFNQPMLGQPMFGSNQYYSPIGQPMGQLEQLRAQFQPQQIQPMQQPVQNGLIWVQGEAGAKSYLVAPGNSVLLMDSESSTFYLKSSDVSGMPSMRVFTYSEKNGVKPAEPTPATDYVTRAEFNEFISRIESSAPANTRKKTKEVAPDGEPAV